MKCKYADKCLFFNDHMEDKPSAANAMKLTYCLSDSSGCARFMVAEALGGPNVPGDLYPNNTAKAVVCISKARKK